MGIKSGIKSMGDKAYPTVIPAKILAASGVSLLFKLKNTAGISVFSCFALSFRFIISSSIPFLSVKTAQIHDNIQPYLTSALCSW